MSIFYNLKLNANSNDFRDATFSNDGESGNVLNNQLDYQVGVVRFKIPINGVPQYRVYANDLKMALVMTGGSIGNPVVSVTLPSNRLENQNVFSGLDIYNNKQISHYGIDLLQTSTLSPKFVDIQSQDSWADLLNRGLAKSYMNNARQFGNNIDTATIAATVTVSNGDNGVIDNVTTIASWQKDVRAPRANGDYGRQLISNIDFELDKLKRNVATATARGFDMKNLEIRLDRYALGEGPKNVVYADNVNGGNMNADVAVTVGTPIESYILLKKGGCDGITNIFYEGLVPTTTTPRLKISNEGDIDVQHSNLELFNSAFSGNRTVGQEITMTTYPSASSGTGFIGKPYDGFNYYLNVYNSTYENDSGIANYFCDFDFDAFEINVEYMIIPIKASTGLYVDATANTDWLAPQFKRDSSDGKLYFNIDNKYLRYWGMDIYMNHRLFSLMSFGEYKALEIDINNFQNYFGDNNWNDNFRGLILKFPLNTFKRNDGMSKLSIVQTSVQSFKESFNTSFARDFINSIVLITSGIAVSGEITGGGDDVRRVLTDFELDPSSIDRDYIVFSASGGATRYYYLGTSAPLRKVDVSVFFEDVNGVLRPLIVPPNMECSIKLEFRPNNMVLNFE